MSTEDPSSNESHLDAEIAALEVATADVNLEPSDAVLRRNDLAALLSERAFRDRSLDDLDHAVELNERALEMAPNVRLDQICRTELGINLKKRWMASGAQADIDRAIDLLREVTTEVAPGDDRRLVILTNLTAALCDRGIGVGAVTDLDESIALSEIAEAELGDDLLHILNNRAVALHSRWGQVADRSDLDRSIATLEQTISIAEDAATTARQAANLSVALHERSQIDGRSDDLDRAIALNEESLAAVAEDPWERARISHNLGCVLLDRARLRDARDDLDRAIEVHKLATDTTPDDSPFLGLRLAAFADAIRHRFRLYHDPSDLDAAIAAGRRSLSPVEGGEIEPTHQTSLAESLMDKWRHAGDRALLEEAIGLSRDASDGRADSPLRFLSLVLVTEFELAAVEAGVETAEIDLGASVARLAAAADAAVAVESVRRGTPVLVRLAAHALDGRVRWDHLGRLGSCLLRRVDLLSALPDHARGEEHWRSDQVSIRSAVDGAMGVTVLALCRSGNASAAIELIERTACALARREAGRIPWAEAETTSPRLASTALKLQVQVLQADPGDPVEDEYLRCLRELRSSLGIPQVESLGVDALRRAASDRAEGFVWLTASPAGTVALRLDPDGQVHSIELPALTTETITNWRVELHPRAESRQELAVAARTTRASRGLTQPDADTVERVVTEVETALATAAAWIDDGRTWVIPTGVTATLPIQAMNPTRRLHSTATQASKVGTDGQPSLLVVFADPTEDLPEASREGLTLERRQHASLYLRSTASMENLLALDPPGRARLHVASHGTEDPAIELSDGRLEFASLPRLRLLWARLDELFLNCCTSGSHHPDVVEQSHGIASVALAAGTRRAVVALWPIPDAGAAAFSLAWHGIAHGPTRLADAQRKADPMTAWSYQVWG